jgi:hypothetical protein
VPSGLLGDWGSGKSSLMRITRQELLKIQDDGELESRYLCVEFSPWQYEDYDDVKVALMTTVLDAVGGQVGGDQRPTIIHDWEPHERRRSTHCVELPSPHRPPSEVGLRSCPWMMRVWSSVS